MMGSEDRHVMVDIETLGTRPGSVIVSMGAVCFTPKGLIDREYSANIDVKLSHEAGMKIDPDTVLWWMKQSSEAISETFDQFGTTSPADAFKNFLYYLYELGPKYFWSHGASFDIPLIEEAAAILKFPKVFDFRFVRDTRTLYELADVDPKLFREAGEKAHSAVDDARAQAMAVIEALRKISKWRFGGSRGGGGFNSVPAAVILPTDQSQEAAKVH